MDYAAIGKRIRAHRKRLNLSQEELAEMVNISTVHIIKNQVACALGVRTDDLIFDKDALGKTELLEEITLELQDCSNAQLLALRQILSSSKDAISKYL